MSALTKKLNALAIGHLSLVTILSMPALAQIPATETPPSAQSLETNAACNPGSVARPATAPEKHATAGTAPGNIGSTGWTGGTGGAHMGTSPQGALPESRTWQPPTARGLDLAMAATSDRPSAKKSTLDQRC